MTNEAFILFCKEQIALSFKNTKSGRPDAVQKHRTEGLIHAAKLLGILDQKSIEALIEQEHLAVFDESVKDRKARKKALSDLKETAPDKYYAIPAFERM